MHADHIHHPHHRKGWVRSGGRRGRWLEPFVLLLLAQGVTHGYSLIDRLNELGATADGVDVGMVYRTLREFEAEGLVESAWRTPNGAPRREYRLTAGGHDALREWRAVMQERARLIQAFLDGTTEMERPQGG